MDKNLEINLTFQLVGSLKVVLKNILPGLPVNKKTRDVKLQGQLWFQSTGRSEYRLIGQSCLTALKEHRRSLNCQQDHIIFVINLTFQLVGSLYVVHNLVIQLFGRIMQILEGSRAAWSLVYNQFQQGSLQPAGASLQGERWLGQRCRAGSHRWEA